MAFGGNSASLSVSFHACILIDLDKSHCFNMKDSITEWTDLFVFFGESWQNFSCCLGGPPVLHENKGNNTVRMTLSKLK